MANLSVLSWNNEAALSPYPLSASFGYDSLLIDANFVQFDGFVPVLQTIEAGNDLISFIIQFDRAIKTVTVNKQDLVVGEPYTVLIKQDTRYLGKLILGGDTYNLYQELANRTFNLNLKFLPFLVKSIPSKAGVYKLQASFGELTVTSDSVISYAVNLLNYAGHTTPTPNVEFSALAEPPKTDELILLSLNSVLPTNNSLYMKDTDVLKITSDLNTFNVSMRGLSLDNVLFQQNNTIPINETP